MSVVVALLTLVLLAAVMAVVSRPLLTARKPVESRTPERAELEAAREAKYREIRDTELDFRTGKLSSEDYQAVNGALRGEAIEILDRLDALDGEVPGALDGEVPGALDGEVPGALDGEAPGALQEGQKATGEQQKKATGEEGKQ